MSLRRSGGGGGSGGGANKIKEGGADWRQDSVARMAKRADQMQGPHNVFTWLRDAREACASLEPSELLLYRQAGWSIEQIVSHCRVVGGAELPFPSTFRASNEEIVTAAFQGGESRRGSPRSSDAPSIVQVSKRGDLERKNGAGMWAPCFCVLSDSFLLVFDTEAQYKRLKRSRSQSSASLAEVAPHSYGLNEAEAVCRLGREIHLFRCMGKLLRLRSTTSELASEWVEALAIAGAQSTKDGELLSQSQLVSQAYLQQLSGHLNSLRTKLGAEFEASIADMARAKKAELQQLRTNLDEELSRKQVRRVCFGCSASDGCDTQHRPRRCGYASVFLQIYRRSIVQQSKSTKRRSRTGRKPKQKNRRTKKHENMSWQGVQLPHMTPTILMRLK